MKYPALMRDSGLGDSLWFLRRPMQFLADVAILSAAFLFAFQPAINIQLSDYNYEMALNQVAFVVLVQFSALFLAGAYSMIWRYVSIPDLKVFLKAAFVSGSILLALRFLLTYSSYKMWQVPISVILIDTVMGFGGVLSLRVLRRVAYELGEKRPSFGTRKRVRRKPTLIVGAGRMGSALAKEMRGHADAELEIRGFVDDDPRKAGGSLGGLKVLGSTDDLPRLVDEINIEQVVLAIDSAQGKEIRRILEICGALPVKTQIVPSLNEIVHGRVSVSRVRDVQIEDLLGREPVKLDDKNLFDFLSQKTILVTGAGGSIGSELVRQIVSFNPRKVLLVERAEYFLFEIAREIADALPDVAAVPLIADIADEHRMREIFEQYSPEIVFHAAAHKHVPLMETNVAEAVKNNILATHLVASLAGQYGTEHFVLISTDKAVNPTSVMGASKRMAEIAVQSLGASYSTRYIAVRFGNVLGSAGSVVPIFREQIRKGEPITVTHKDMTRYFMTIPEASQLVLQAGALGQGGEIFILDMGQPVRILDLAEDMIRLSGLTPYEDIDIRFTGIRPGEKLFEELEISGENLLKTVHPQIFIGKIAEYDESEVAHVLKNLGMAVDNRDPNEIRRLFNEFIPEAKIEQAAAIAEPGLTAESDQVIARPSRLGLAEE